jgi:hypothetical protein
MPPGERVIAAVLFGMVVVGSVLLALALGDWAEARFP